jgi:hypothetical protein
VFGHASPWEGLASRVPLLAIGSAEEGWRRRRVMSPLSGSEPAILSCISRGIEIIWNFPAKILNYCL